MSAVIGSYQRGLMECCDLMKHASPTIQGWERIFVVWTDDHIPSIGLPLIIAVTQRLDVLSPHTS